MLKINLLLMATTSAFIFTACGGSSSPIDPNSIESRKYIVIFKDVPSGICESQAYKDNLKSQGFEDLITKETDEDTTCETYGRVDDKESCGVEYYTDIGSTDGTTCIVGVNGINGIYSEQKYRKIDSNNYLYSIYRIAKETMKY